MATAIKPLDRNGFMKRALIIKNVDLPDGSIVCIRALPASFIIGGAENAATVFTPANMLVNSLCDEQGNLLFTEGEKELTLTVDHVSLKVIMDSILELNALAPAKDGEANPSEKN